MRAENAATLINAFPNIFESLLGRYKSRNPHAIFSVGDGWFMILWDIAFHIRELQSQIPFIEIDILQIKEKLGGLRFYYQCTYKDEGWGSKTFRKIDEWVRGEMCGRGYYKAYWALTKFRKKHIYRTVFEKVATIVSKGEFESYQTCEVCGEIGIRCSPNGWLLVLCEKHKKEHEKEKD